MPKVSFSPPPDPDRPATEAQMFKLLVMAKAHGIIWSEHFIEDLWDYEGFVVDWVNETLGLGIEGLNELTHFQIGRCYREME